MRGVDLYAIAACVVTLWASSLLVSVSRRRGPSRGMGGAQAALIAVGIWVAGVLHGSVVSGIALALGRTPVAWSAAGLHGFLILIAIARFKK